ncbi:MAG TPA: hypothetical protein VN682_13740 [Terriglobales bacterium]|jgi:hypothetical protein|nr:hypothetical protein [Terriglobales bacterium]
MSFPNAFSVEGLGTADAYLLAASSSQSKFPVEKQELYAGSSGETPFWRGISGLATMN